MANKVYNKAKKIALLDTTTTGSKITSYLCLEPNTYSRVGNDKPKFRDAIMKGLNATNDMYVTINRGKLTQKGRFAYTLNKYKGYCACEGAGVTYVALTSAHVPTDLKTRTQNAAAIGIRLKIRDASTTYSGLTFLGELRKTIHMIRHPAEALSKKVLQFKDKASKVKGKHAKTVLPDMYLEAVFGWQPLMSDIDGMAKAAATTIEKNRVAKLSHTSILEYADTPSIANVIASPNAWLNIDRERSTVVRARHTYVVGYQVKVPIESGINSLIALGGFNLQEVIPTAWELLPWSFMVDYFSNIGDVITSNSVDMSSIAYSYQKIRYDVDHRHVSQKVSSSVNYTMDPTNAPASYTSSYIYIERKNVSIPYGRIDFELPGSSTQKLNIAALILARDKPR